ncbi:MAG: hypothetical protein EOO74_08570 [Myxococcales bacterium]|nr:MAG: hypothetical protein EOO74_08570 [Myxococcales bacterium]
MKETYRDPAKAVEPTAPVTTHVCRLTDGDRRRWMGLVYVKAMVTVVACGVVSLDGVSWWTLLTLVVGVLWIRRDVRARQAPGIVFRVQNGRLNVRREGATDIDVTLEKLHDVRLDTRASSRELTLSHSKAVNLYFGMSAGHSIDLDVSRIELVTAGETRPLVPEFTSNTRCTEEMGAIRRFLRTHGWEPLGERRPAEAKRPAQKASEARV